MATTSCIANINYRLNERDGEVERPLGWHRGRGLTAAPRAEPSAAHEGAANRAVAERQAKRHEHEELELALATYPTSYGRRSEA